MKINILGASTAARHASPRLTGVSDPSADSDQWVNLDAELHSDHLSGHPAETFVECGVISVIKFREDLRTA